MYIFTLKTFTEVKQTEKKLSYALYNEHHNVI